MWDTFARGRSFHTFRLIRPDQFEYAILNRGPHHRGDRLFRDTSSDDTYRCMHTCIGYFRPTANWNLESPEFLHECWKKCKVVHSSPQAVVGACSCMGLRLWDLARHAGSGWWLRWENPWLQWIRWYASWSSKMWEKMHVQRRKNFLLTCIWQPGLQVCEVSWGRIQTRVPEPDGEAFSEDHGLGMHSTMELDNGHFQWNCQCDQVHQHTAEVCNAAWNSNYVDGIHILLLYAASVLFQLINRH